MLVRRAIFEDLPAIRIAFSHLVDELESQRLVPYPTHDAATLDDFTVHLAGRLMNNDPRLFVYVALEDETRALLGFFGAEVSERLLGYPTRFAACHWLYVAPPARKLGVARALLRCAVEDAVALGLTHVELVAVTGDDQWIKRGWVPFLVHYVLPLEGAAAGVAERPPTSVLVPEPALVVPVSEPEPIAAANGNGHPEPRRTRKKPYVPTGRPRGRPRKVRVPVDAKPC